MALLFDFDVLLFTIFHYLLLIRENEVGITQVGSKASLLTTICNRLMEWNHVFDGNED